MSVDVLPQPLTQRGELAVGKQIVEVRHLAVRGVPQLARDQVPERVGWEIADQSGRPVNVLEDPVGVVGDVEPEIVLDPSVPCLRQVGHGEPILDQLLLKLEAQHDVQPVRRLVGLDPDERRLDVVDRAVQRVGIDRTRSVEQLGQPGREDAGERTAAADHVLPHSALRLVDPERLAVTERRAAQRVRNARLVETVTALVHRAVQAGRKVRLVPARRDPHIAGPDPGGERMHGVVHPPPRPVKAHQVQHVRDEPPLTLDRKAPVKARGIDAGLVLGERRNHRHELGLQLIEQRAHLSRLHPGLIVVEQRVVWALELVKARNVVAGELEVVAEIRRKRAEVGVLAGHHPRLLADRGRPCDLGSEVGWNPAGLLVMAAGDPDEACVIALRGGPVDLGPGRLEQLPGLLGDEHLVADPLDRRERFGPGRPAARRHHRLLVPAEQAGGVAKVLEGAKAGSKLL